MNPCTRCATILFLHTKRLTVTEAHTTTLLAPWSTASTCCIAMELDSRTRRRIPTRRRSSFGGIGPSPARSPLSTRIPVAGYIHTVRYATPSPTTHSDTLTLHTTHDYSSEASPVCSQSFLSVSRSLSPSLPPSCLTPPCHPTWLLPVVLLLSVLVATVVVFMTHHQQTRHACTLRLLLTPSRCAPVVVS